MKTSNTILLLALVLLLTACGTDNKEAERRSSEERAKQKREYALALKVGVVPTIDCLPLYVAHDLQLFDTARADIRLRRFHTAIDCNEALAKGRIEGCVTDLVRCCYLRHSRGIDTDCVATTVAHWQLIANKRTKVRRAAQLAYTRIAMTRFSATALMASQAADSVAAKGQQVHQVQINDPDLRLQMLLNNEMDAALLAEPQATAARLQKHTVLATGTADSLQLGVGACSSKATASNRRAAQIAAFIDGYNAACDSLNKHGLQHYADIIRRHYHADSKTIADLPKTTFPHATAPQPEYVTAAETYIKTATSTIAAK